MYKGRQEYMRSYNNIKIAIAGTGYVGLSMAVLLSQHHDVVAVDVVEDKVKKLNSVCQIINKYF